MLKSKQMRSLRLSKIVVWSWQPAGVHVRTPLAVTCVRCVLLYISKPSFSVNIMCMRELLLFGVIMLANGIQLCIFARLCALGKCFASGVCLAAISTWCFIWPVLQHGPRSLMHVQVCGFTFWGIMKMTVGMCALTANQSSVRGLSLSMFIRTRKMVNYAWEE